MFCLESLFSSVRLPVVLQELSAGLVMIARENGIKIDRRRKCFQVELGETAHQFHYSWNRWGPHEGLRRAQAAQADLKDCLGETSKWTAAQCVKFFDDHKLPAKFKRVSLLKKREKVAEILWNHKVKAALTSSCKETKHDGSKSDDSKEVDGGSSSQTGSTVTKKLEEVKKFDCQEKSKETKHDGSKSDGSKEVDGKGSSQTGSTAKKKLEENKKADCQEKNKETKHDGSKSDGSKEVDGGSSSQMGSNAKKKREEKKKADCQGKNKETKHDGSKSDGSKEVDGGSSSQTGKEKKHSASDASGSKTDRLLDLPGLANVKSKGKLKVQDVTKEIFRKKPSTSTEAADEATLDDGTSQQKPSVIVPRLVLIKFLEAVHASPAEEQACVHGFVVAKQMGKKSVHAGSLAVTGLFVIDVTASSVDNERELRAWRDHQDPQKVLGRHPFWGWGALRVWVVGHLLMAYGLRSKSPTQQYK